MESYSGNWFVLEEKSREWEDMYRKRCISGAEKQALDGICHHVSFGDADSADTLRASVDVPAVLVSVCKDPAVCRKNNEADEGRHDRNCGFHPGFIAVMDLDVICFRYRDAVEICMAAFGRLPCESTLSSILL